MYAKPLAAGIPFLVTDPATAEMVKVAANAFLATKISFINAMSEARHALDADAWRDCGWDYHAPGRPSHPPGAPDALPGRPAGVRPHQAELQEAAVRFLAAAV